MAKKRQKKKPKPSTSEVAPTPSANAVEFRPSWIGKFLGLHHLGIYRRYRIWRLNRTPWGWKKTLMRVTGVVLALFLALFIWATAFVLIGARNAKHVSDQFVLAMLHNDPHAARALFVDRIQEKSTDDDMATFLKKLRPLYANKTREAERPRVKKISGGATATVLYEFTKGDQRSELLIFLTKEDGKWRVVSASHVETAKSATTTTTVKK